uniref:Uncharacterized protein n=1 Tax=Anguilla anguilla TaxID=7936 RepID=A0A0E9VG54_ANGAN
MEMKLQITNRFGLLVLLIVGLLCLTVVGLTSHPMQSKSSGGQSGFNFDPQENKDS